MLRTVSILVFSLVLGCADPGPRDRSLLRTEDGAEPAPALPAPRPKRMLPSSSVIGLVLDPLAQYYAEDASVVLRFDDATTLRRNAIPQLQEIQRTLPGLRLPVGEPVEMLRRTFGLPDTVVFDPLRPFALVRYENAWVGIVPTRVRQEAGGRLKTLDATYCVAGDPKLVAAYEPSFRKGFFLPGDLSILARPDAVPELAGFLCTLCAERGLPAKCPPFLERPLPDDIDRIDLAMRFQQTGLRLDVRIAPHRESRTAVQFERAATSASATAAWLPADATLYLEFPGNPSRWDGLLRDWSLAALPLDADALPDAFSHLLAALGDDTAVALDLQPSGGGTAYLVSRVDDPAPLARWLRSEHAAAAFAALAGPDGKLAYDPDAFTRNGVTVASITGHVGRSRLTEFQAHGIVRSSLSVLLRGPVVTYLAQHGDRFCLVTGEHSRAEMERLLDNMSAGTPRGNEHVPAADGLFRQRLVATTIDLASLFDGTRDAAPFWHVNGRSLKALRLRWPLPTAVGATIEGGALRIAARVEPRMMADATAKVLRTLGLLEAEKSAAAPAND